jgi:hypothetical protein
VKLKEKEGLYSTGMDGIRIEPGGGGTARVLCDLYLPARAPAGDYQVQLVGFESGAGRRLGSAALHIRRAGIAALIFTLAHRHGFLYGGLAVSVALVVGLSTGLVFGRGARHGH